MKKRLLFIMACVWLSTNLYSKGIKPEIDLNGNSVVITKVMPGGLSSLLEYCRWGQSIYDSKSLTISGWIDERDLNTIRTKMKSLETLDISGVQLSEIPDGAFDCAHSPALKKVIFNDLGSIGNDAFKGCKNLTSISIPSWVTINNDAFKNCKKLTTLTIRFGSRLSTTIIPELNYITKLTISGGFDNGALMQIRDGMKSLTTIDLSKASMDHLDDKAFYKSGVKNVTLPESILSIGVSAFEGCTNLTDISIPSSVETIGDLAFANCNKLAWVTLKDGLQSIGMSAFAGGCMTGIGIPKSVTSIGAGAFQHCSKLNNIPIPDLVNTINELTFADCKELEIVRIGKNVQNIKKGALGKIHEIYSYAETPPTLSSELEPLGTSKVVYAYVPAGTVSAYKNAEYWNKQNVIISEIETNLVSLDGIPLYLPDFTMPFINVGYLAPAFKDNTTTTANDVLSLSQNENSILAINGISKEGNGLLTVFKNENGGITINGINPAGGGTVTVRDMGGRVLQTCSIIGTSTTVNKNFGAGIYLVTVNTQGNTITKKVVL
jgi:hypothetical protein